MTEYANRIDIPHSWVREKVFLEMPITNYLKGLITPFNIIAGIIVLVGLSLTIIRYSQGLGAVTAASQDQPWGLFLSWGLFSGVPLSATGFVLGTAVYLFGLKEYKPVVKNALLIGFLGYLFAVIFLLIDLGRPWRLPYPMFGAFGTASVLFLVAWHVALYLSVQFLEFAPSIFEWGGWKTLRRWTLTMTVGLTILGVILSTLHQSALGAMFLLTPGKLHPLWYSPYLPPLFFISAIAAGLCMVIFVSALTQRFFKNQADSNYLGSLDRITLGLGKAASFVLITYFALKVVALAHGNNWDLLNTPFGYWFLVELLIFVLLPCFLFVLGVRSGTVSLVRFAAIFTIIGLIINRLNVSLIALNWQLPHREFFDWREFLIVIAVITVEILVYRWVVKRMPVLRKHPDYGDEH
jgi:Ni/Fe-hydrogenase subunit HybB-like protein